jgi:transposase
MPTRGKPYPREIRERAVRMVLEHQQEYESQWEAICSVADKLGPTARLASRTATPWSVAY